MKPILFNTEMVQAILAGRKTVTRLVVKPQPEGQPTRMLPGSSWPRCFAINGTNKVIKPPYQIGDILYVRETFCGWCLPGEKVSYCYKATDPCGNRYPTGPEYDDEWDVRPWRPSIHMPKEAARLFLRVTDVRVERLKGITELGALAEGIKDPYDYQTPAWYEQHNLTTSYSRDAFAGLWNSTVKKANLPLYGWDANPWVWVIEFEKISKEEALKSES